MTPDDLAQDLMLPTLITSDAVAVMIDEAVEGAMQKLASKMINGVPAVGVDFDDATLWVATTGEPYPLRMEGKGASKETLIEFSAFGEKVELTPPAAGTTMPYSASELAQLDDLND
jgi:hypothetical protein